jgi:hypothetical protein
MSIVHLLIIVVPSFAAGLIFGRSHLTGACWGIAAEAIGLLMVALPIPSGGPRNGLSLAMISMSVALGALAGALGFGALRLVKSRH